MRWRMRRLPATTWRLRTAVGMVVGLTVFSLGVATVAGGATRADPVRRSTTMSTAVTPCVYIGVLPSPRDAIDPGIVLHPTTPPPESATPAPTPTSPRLESPTTITLTQPPSRPAAGTTVTASAYCHLSPPPVLMLQEHSVPGISGP